MQNNREDGWNFFLGLSIGETLVEAVAQDLVSRDEALKQLKLHLQHAQEQMSKYANVHRKVSNIKVGDKVFLKIRPHRQSSMPTKLHPKLAARYYGPFPVIKQVGAVAFNSNCLPLLEYTRSSMFLNSS